MTGEELVARFDGVKRTGPDSWMCRCPAHADRSPSLSVTDKGGTILMTCFAGCTVQEIVTAAGVKLEDLFPPRQKDEEGYKRERYPINPMDALEGIAFECSIVAIAARDILDGKRLTELDLGRMNLAIDRINTTVAYVRSRNRGFRE